MIDIETLLRSKNINLTTHQNAAIKHTKGPALILAVPGAGKTTIIMGIISNLIANNNVKAEEILAITFSKSSAMDMTKKFKSLFGEEHLGDVKFSTIHSFGNWIVSSYN